MPLLGGAGRSAPRRLPALAVAVVALCGLVLAGLVLPAAAQTAAYVTIDSIGRRCANPGDNFDVPVSGRTNRTTLQIEFKDPSGTVIFSSGVSGNTSTQTYNTSFVFGQRAPGTYEVHVFAVDTAAEASVFFEVPCQAPTLEFAPTCFPVGYSGTVTMTGRHFVPNSTPHTVIYDVNGSETQTRIRIPADNRGVVTAAFTVTPSNRAHPGRIQDSNGGLVALASWNSCPPGPTTTTTSSSTTVPGSTTTTATTQPDDTVPDETTTTTRPPPDTPGTPVTIPPTIDLPPPTPGATLTVAPELGPAGFVTSVRGTGFPPGGVDITWAPGIGSTAAIVGPDGTFSANVLVFPNDRIGPRAIVASGAGTTAFDAFLVVQSSVQPSGQNVQQINRIRRFNQR